MTHGAAKMVGGQPSFEGFLPSIMNERGALPMINWNDIFQYTLVITAIATLFYNWWQKKIAAPVPHPDDYFLVNYG